MFLNGWVLQLKMFLNGWVSKSQESSYPEAKIPNGWSAFSPSHTIHTRCIIIFERIKFWCFFAIYIFLETQFKEILKSHTNHCNLLASVILHNYSSEMSFPTISPSKKKSWTVFLKQLMILKKLSHEMILYQKEEKK